MHRSGSTTRVSDEYFSTMALGSTGKTPPNSGQRSSGLGYDQLPTYDPLSDVAKKEAARARTAEHAVHMIPLVLVVCALVLWFFSSPQMYLAAKEDSIAAKVKNMTIDGYSDSSALDIGQEGIDTVEPKVGGEARRRLLPAGDFRVESSR